MKPTPSASDCGHADVSNEATNPDFYVGSLVTKCWQLSQIFVKHFESQSKQGCRLPIGLINFYNSYLINQDGGRTMKTADAINQLKSQEIINVNWVPGSCAL